MIQLRSRPRFARKPLQSPLVVREMIGNKLQGNMPSKPQIFGLVDNPHPTPAQLRQNLVVGDGLSEHVHSEVRDVASVGRTLLSDAVALLLPLDSTWTA